MELSVLSGDERMSYVEFTSLIDQWAILGVRLYKNGTRCIGHIPHRAPEAYLHRLLGPLDDSSIWDMQDVLEWDFPSSFARFLRLHNGVDVFTMFIGIDGFRTSWKRTDDDEMAQQPFDITTHNVHRRPSDAPDDMLFIGSLGDERGLVGLLPTGEVLQWGDKCPVPGTRYANVFEFLLLETKKARPLFDDIGKRKDGSDIMWKPS